MRGEEEIGHLRRNCFTGCRNELDIDSNKVRPVGGDNFTGYRNESGMAYKHFKITDCDFKKDGSSQVN